MVNELTQERYRRHINNLINKLKHLQDEVSVLDPEIRDVFLQRLLDATQYIPELNELVAEAYKLMYLPLKARGEWTTIIFHWSHYAIHAARSSDNLSLLTDLSVQLAVLYTNQGRLHNAELVYQETLICIQTQAEKYPQEMANLLFQYGVCLVKQGRHTVAEELLQKGIYYCQLASDLYCLGFIQNQIANIALAKKDYAQALSALDEGMRIWFKLGEESRMSRIVIYGRGKIFLAQKNYRKAELAFREALYLNEQLSATEGAARCAEQLATTLLKQGNFEIAKRYYYKALDFAKAETTIDFRPLIKSHFGLLQISILIGDFGEIIPLLSSILADISYTYQGNNKLSGLTIIRSLCTILRTYFMAYFDQYLK